MRINEIITESLDEEIVDEYSHTSFGITAELKKKGYKVLGSGVDQTAFLEPKTGLVLKIFGTNETNRFSNDHKMFFKWAKFCEANQNKNPFLPRFYGHESFFWKGYGEDEKHRYLMIRTEPLKDSGRVGSVLSRMASGVTEEGDTVKNVMRYLQETNPNTYRELTQRLGENGMVQFLNTAKRLYQIGDRAGYAWDLHSGNIMMRKDGTPVINDPWVV